MSSGCDGGYTGGGGDSDNGVVARIERVKRLRLPRDVGLIAAAASAAASVPAAAATAAARSRTADGKRWDCVALALPMDASFSASATRFAPPIVLLIQLEMLP
jgi:hypothetical protein